MKRRILLLTTTLLTWAIGVNAQSPNITNGTPNQNFINEGFCFTSTFTNSGPEGYNPLVRLIVPEGITFNNVTFLGSGATVVDAGVVDATGLVEDPFLIERSTDPAINQIAADPGSQVYVIQIPVGSVVSGGVPLNLDFCMTIEAPPTTQVEVPLPISLEPVYELGSTPTGSGDPIIGSRATRSVIPTLYSMSKGNDAPRGERPPGEAWPITYTVGVNIASGQTIDNLAVGDDLPANLKLVPGTISADCGGGTISFSDPNMDEPYNDGLGPGVPGGSFSVTCPSVTGGSVAITYDAYVIDILDQTFCDEEGLENSAVVNGGTYAGTDITTLSPAIHDNTANSTVTARHLTMQHGPSDGTVRSGQTVTFTANFQINEYDAETNNLVLTATIPDGMTYTSVANATGSIGGVNLPLNSATYETITPLGGGQTQVVWNLRDAYASVQGGNNIPTRSEGTISYTVEIDDTYEVTGEPVLSRDDLTIPLRASYGLVEGAAGCVNNAPAGVTVEGIAISKNVINIPANGYGPGDRVTYVLSMDIPSGDANGIFFEEFLPLPIFDVNEFDPYTPGGTETIGAVGSTNQIRYASAEAEGLGFTPEFEIEMDKNLLRIKWGDLGTLAEDRTLDIIFEPTVTNQPFDDGLFHTNFLQAGTLNTPSAAATQLETVPITVGAAELEITKGIKNVGFSTSPMLPKSSVTLTPGGTAVPIDNDAEGVEGNDVITYVITIQNIGGASAFNVQIRDVLPPELTNPTVVSITDGTSLPGGDLSGKFSNATQSDLFGAGLAINDGEFIAEDDGIDGSGPDVIVIEYTAEVVATVTSLSDFTNTASVIYKNGFDDPARTDDNIDFFPSVEEVAMATVTSPEIEKNRSTFIYKSLANWPTPVEPPTEPNDASDTNNPTNAGEIGDFVVYTLELIIPEGVTPNAVITDVMDPNLRYYTGTPVVFAISDNVGGAALTYNTGATVTTNSVNGGVSNEITINLGDIQNNSGDDDEEIITITYAAEVVDLGDGNNQTTIDNDATLAFTGGSVNDMADSFDLIIPELQVTKLVRVNDGTGITYSHLDYSASLSNVNTDEDLQFLIILENQSLNLDVYNLNVRDIFDAADLTGFTFVGARRGDGTPSNSTVNTPGTSGDIFDAANGLTLDGSDLAGSPNYTLPRRAPGQAAGPTNNYGPETILIVVTADIQPAIEFNSTLENTAAATYYVEDGCPGGASCILFEDDDVVQVTVRGIPSFDKELITQVNDYTSSLQTNLMEELVYRLTFTMPVGVANNVIIYDTLDVGLNYQNASITMPVISTSSGGGMVTVQNSPPDFSISTHTDGRTLLAIEYGRIENTTDTDQTISIEYTSRVADVASNTEGTELNNIAELDYSTSSTGVITVSATSDSVIIMRPELEVEKIIIGTNNSSSSITGGNLIDADGSDEVTFQVTIRNTDPISRAYDLNFSDELPDGLTGGTITSIALGNGSASSFVELSPTSSPFTRAEFFGTAPDGNFFTNAGLSSESGFDVYLEPNQGSLFNELRITYTATIDAATAIQPLDINNEVSVDYNAGPGAVNSTLTVTDNATITGFAPRTFTKELISISPNVAGSGNVQVGEILLYRITVGIPEGSLNDFNIIDQIDSESDGIIYLDLRSVTVENVASTITKTLPSVSDITTITPTITDSGTQLRQRRDRLDFRFGTITNTDNDADEERLVIEYYVTVGNDNSVRQGTDVRNRANYNYNDASGTNVNGPVVRAPELFVEDPRVNIAKTFDAATAQIGDVVNVEIEINTDRGNAFDVTIEDALPTGMVYSGNTDPTVGANFVVPGGLVSFTGIADGSSNVGIAVGTLANGQTLTFTFPVEITAGFTCGGLVNTAELKWQSIPGDFNALLSSLSIANDPAYPPCTGERRGSGGGGCSDFYDDDASATLNIQPIITANLANPICADGTGSVTLEVPDFGAGTTYQWERENPFGSGTFVNTGGNSRFLVISNVSASDATQYRVQVTQPSCTPLTSALYGLNVIEQPAEPAFAANPLGVCEGESIELNTTTTYPFGTTYAWAGPNGFTANVRSTIISNATTAEAGIYTLTVTEPSGNCSTLGNLQVNVTAQPAQPDITGDRNLCEGSTLNLVGTTYSGGTVVYNWTLPATSVRTPPTGPNLNFANLVADDAGVYTLQVEVDGCATPPRSVNVTVAPAPGMPDITPASGAICQGEPLNLSTTAIADSYEWSGPNSFSSTAPNPSVTNDFQNIHAGTYILTTTTGSCTATNSVTFTLDAAPTQPVLTISNNPICQGDAILVEANPTTGITQYTWISPNGVMTNTVGNTTAFPSTDPAYAAGDWRVRVTNGSGCTAESDPVTLTITPQPTSAPASNAPAAGVCPGDDVLLVGNEVTGATYRWYEDDGDNTLEIGTGDPLIAITQNHTVSNFTMETRYFLVVDVNGCTSSASVNVPINTGTAPDFTVNDVNICEGEVLSFTAPISATSYQWSGPGGFSSTDANPLVTNNAAEIPHEGEYSVTTFSATCGSRTRTFDVFVNPNPSTPVISASPANVCENDNFQLNSSVTAGANEEYRWISPTGTVTQNTDNPFTVVGTTANGGEWVVQIINTTINCISEVSAPVTITIIPETPAIPTATPTVCEGDAIVLTGNEAPGALYRWYQDDGDGVQQLGAADVLVGTSRITSVPNLGAGSYTFWLDLNVSGCNNVADVDVTVSPKPTISNIQNPVELNCTPGNTDLSLNQNTSGTGFFDVTPAGTYSYVWTGPNGFSSVDVNPIIPTANSGDQGTYTVYVEDANGCRSDAVSLIVDITDAIETPIINFAGRLCEGEEMELRVEPPYSGTSVSYEWFLDGVSIPSTAANPNPTTIPSYIVPSVDKATHEGLYSVQVSVTNGNPADPDPTVAAQAYTCVSLISAQTNVEIVENPDLSNDLIATYNGELSTTMNFDCPGGTIQLTNPMTNAAGDAYLWTGPNGYTSTERNPTIINAGLEYNGTYELTVTNGGLCSISRTIDMNLIKPQPATPTVSGPMQVCEGDGVIFNVPAYTGASVSYNWTTPTGNQTTAVPQLTVGSAAAANAGNYQLTVTVDGCASLLSAPINLSVEPTLSAPTIDVAGSVTTVCEGGNIELFAQNYTPTPDKYIWTGPNGFTFETTVNSSVIITNATTADDGTYQLQVERNGCISPADSETITVNPAPTQPSLNVNALALCSDEDLELTASVVAGATSYIFIKPNGGTMPPQAGNTLTIPPTVAGAANPDYLSGAWRVRVVDGNSCNSPTSDPVNITINQKPSALALNDGPVCLGSDANLFGNSVAGATYEWFEDTDNSDSFTAGDALIATGQNHTISSTDLTDPTEDYYYFLRVTREGCASDIDETIVNVTTSTITPDIRANGTDITGAPPMPPTQIEVCEGEQVILSSPTASSSYTWNGPDGFTSSLQSPASFIANPASAGVYTLEIVSAGCATNQQRFELVVNPTPTQPVISASSLNVCDEPAAEINLTATAVAGVNYIWIQPNGIEFNGGTTNTLDILSSNTAQYLEGEWRVRLENTTTGCVSETSNPITIDINPLPTAVPTSGGNVCSGENVQLFGNTVAGASYNWYQDNGNGTFDGQPTDALISTNQNPIVSGLNATGSPYKFWLVIEANGCDATAVDVDVEVNAPPTFTANATPELCLDPGASYNGLTATPPATGGPYTFRWTGPNGYESSAEDPVIPNATAANSGSYTVVMTDATTGCESNPETVNVTIANRPATPILSVSATALCEGEPLTLSTNPVSGAAYRWYRGATALATTDIPSYIINSTTNADEGNYSVEIIADPPTASCISALSGQINVQIDAIPAAPALVVNPTTAVCEGSSLTIELPAGYDQPGYTYQWVGPNGFTASTSNAFISLATVASNGTYSVTVSNGSCGSSATASITVNNVLPIPPTPGLSTNPFICTGEVLELRTDAFNSATTQYEWFFDDGGGEVSLGTTTNPSFVVSPSAATTDAGLYSVEVSAGGCTSPRSLAQQVTVNPQPGNPVLTTNYTNGNCAGGDLQLTVTSTNATGYLWTGPNGFVSTQQNPVIPNATATANGTYVVIVSNGACTNTGSIIFNDIIDITPFSPAIIPPNPVCVGERTVITASNYAGAGSSVTYNWTLPDGSTFTSGSNQLVIDPVTLASGGNYTVQVDVDGCSLPTSLPERLRVNEFPSTPMPTSNSPVCEDGTIRLFAGAPTTGGPYTYEWTGPRNFFSNLENPTIDLVSPDYEGTYVLTLSGPGGCSVTSTVQVSVGALIAPPTIAGDERYCIGDRLELTATTYPGEAEYTWTLPDGTNRVTTVGQLVIESVTAANDGNYSVRVKVSDCETGTSFAKRVFVDNAGSVEATSNTGICEGETLQLSATPSNTTVNYTYRWEGPNGFTSTLQNPTINGATSQNSGVYVVSISTSGSGCTQTAEVNVAIDAQPETPFLISNQSVICEGDPIILSTGSQGATYQWIGPDGTIDPNDNVLTTTTGTTTIPATHPSYRSGVWRVRVIGTGGCESEFSQPTEIEIANRPVAIISNNNTVCEGEEVAISGNEFVGASYSWYDDNNGARGQLIATGRTLDLGVLPSGAYTYYLIVSVNGCTSEVAAAQVNVVGAGLVPTPTTASASVCGGNDIQLFSNIEADFYNWTGPNGFVSGEQNPVIPNATPSDAGRYALTVTQNNCTSSPGTTVVAVTDGAQAIAINPITAVCESERLVISSQGLAGTNVTYTWIKPDGSQQTTTGPSLIIENAQTTDAGAYFVTVNNNGCVSAPSAAVFATVNAKPSAPEISITSQLCEGDAIVLSTPINADNYLWTGPNGFSSTLKNPRVIQNATAFDAGEYTLWVENNGCRSEISSAQVSVSAKPATPQIFSNSPVCSGGRLELFTTRVSATEQYTWYLPDGTTRITQDTFLIVEPFTSVTAGNYQVSRTESGCASERSIAIQTSVIIGTVEEAAFAGDDLFICDLSQAVTLTAAANQRGTWTALDGGNLATPTLNSTVVSGLSPEQIYRFVWTVDNRPCGDLSRDTVSVQASSSPVANADTEETTLDGFDFKDILLNDDVPNGDAINVRIIRPTTQGEAELQLDNTLSYRPAPGYFGFDSLIYEICLVDCPTNCDTASVVIEVIGEMEIPDIITPNGDGNNDAFVIRGIENYPENELLIFNRWGNKVYEQINYQNDWRGTWNNNELPDGTYYYVFTNRQNGQLISKGFITIHR